MKWLLPAFVLSAFLTAGCGNRDAEAESAGDVMLYRDYRISADEAGGIVTIRLQYRRGGRNGTAVTLPGAAEVRLDGEQLRADSVGKIGTFYEIQKEAVPFEGQHVISFRDESGKLYTDSFSFQSVNISAIPEVMPRQDLPILLEGAPDGTPVHLVLTDTSFLSDDLNEIDTVRDGQISITASDLAALRSGPVQLQLIKEIQVPLREAGRIRGTLFVSYSLQRESILQD